VSAQVILGAYERRRFQTELINEMPLYPTERLLWDEHQIPSVNYTGALRRAPVVLAPPPAYLALCQTVVTAAISHMLLPESLIPCKYTTPWISFRAEADAAPVVSRGDVPGAAEAEPAVPDHPRLPAAQLQPVPAGGDVRDQGGHRRRAGPCGRRGRLGRGAGASQKL